MVGCVVGISAGTVIYNVFGINAFESATGIGSAALTGISDFLSGQTNVSLTQGSLSGQIGGGTITSGLTQIPGAVNPIGTIDFILDLYGSSFNRGNAPVIGNNNAFTFSFGR